MRRREFRSRSSLRRPPDRLRCNVRLVDTALLTAANTKLEKLGADLGLPKIVLPAGYAKDRMDLFLAERRDEFVNYAMTDARIAALWTARIFDILSSLGVERSIATLGAASVHLARQELANQNVDFNAFLGLERRKRGKPTPMATPGKSVAIRRAMLPRRQEHRIRARFFTRRAASWSTSTSGPPTRQLWR